MSPTLPRKRAIAAVAASPGGLPSLPSLPSPGPAAAPGRGRPTAPRPPTPQQPERHGGGSGFGVVSAPICSFADKSGSWMRRQMEQLALLEWCGMSRAASPASPAAGQAVVGVEMEIGGVEVATTPTPTLAEIELELLGGVRDAQPLAGAGPALPTPGPPGGADAMDLDGYDGYDAPPTAPLLCGPAAAAAAAAAAAVAPGFGAACPGRAVAVPILSESAAKSRLVARRRQRHLKRQASKEAEAEAVGCSQPKRQ